MTTATVSGHPESTRDWAKLRLIGRFGFVALTPFGQRYQCTMFAVVSKNAMETSEINPPFGHQDGQSGNELHGLENHIGRALPVGCSRLVADVPTGR